MLVLFYGCAINGYMDDATDDGLVTVERSKAVRPNWVTLPTGQLVESPTSWRFIHLRTHVLNLPLGLPQAQQTAQFAATAALGVRLKEQVSDLKTPILPASVATLNRAVAASATAIANRYFHVGDIYYERVIDTAAPSAAPMASYYRMYILMIFSLVHEDELFADLVARLEATDSLDLRQLAVAIKMMHLTAPLLGPKAENNRGNALPLSPAPPL